MIDISFSKVEKSFGSNKILENISFDIKENEKIALVGVNGSGKSTILNMICGKEKPTGGTISLRRGASIGMLEQVINKCDDNFKVRDYLNKGIQEIVELKRNLEYLEEKLISSSSIELEQVIDKYAKTQEKFISLGGYEIDSMIGKIIKVFNISDVLLEKNFNELSGGEKTIVSLATLILNKPDILLLDEPTNHLDIDTIEWLEVFLKNYTGTVLIVSHDRYFLDAVVNKTMLIDKNNVEIFHGNYSYFLEENEARILNEFKNYKDQQKKIDAMKKAIKQLREWGNIAKNEMFFKRANSIEKRLDAMEKIDKPHTKKSLPIYFDMVQRSGKIVVDIKDLWIKYEKDLFKKANATIYFGERVCLMGKNGSGKSTLIKEIINNNNSCIKLGANILLGYIPQELVFENENLTIIEEARKFFVGEEQYLRAALDKFLFFGECIFKKIKMLSGGEKVRLKLFCLMQEKYNFLVLDEITNHIDIDTKEVLEEALISYKGSILFISHDRYFVNKIATRILSIENNRLVSYIGNYEDYKKGN